MVRWLWELIPPATLVAYLLFLLRDDRQFRRHLAQVEAARAAEAPCEALSHVRLIPQDQAVPEPELAPEDDLFVRMVDALNIFAEDNGYAVPVPTLWLALASVVAEAILGRGPGGGAAG